MTLQRHIKEIEKRDNLALKKRAFDLFTNRRVGNMGPDLYTNGGGDKYSQIISTNEQYIPYQGEVALIQEKKSDIARWAKDIDTVIIIGPGPAQTMETKELPILKLLPALKTVKLIDLSEQFNAQAAKVLEQSFEPPLYVETYTGDFNTVTLNQNYSRALVITTGSLTNFEDAPLDSFPSSIAGSYLRRFQEMAKPGGKILWGYDSNSNAAAIEAEYESSEISAFVLNPLNKLSSTSGVDIDPKKFIYTPEFFPRGSHLAHYWTATAPQNVEIDDETISIFEGDRFLCFSSIKLNPDKLNIIAQNKGLSSHCAFTHSNSKQILHCFDYN